MAKRARRGWGSVVKKGKKYYFRFTKPDGKRTWRFAGDTRDEAEKFVEGLRRASEAGPAPKAVRLEEWLRDDYLRVLASRVTANSLQSAATHFTRICAFLRDHAGDPTMDRVTRADAERFVAWMRENDYAPGYVHRLVNTLRRAWEDAANRRLVHENPWRKMRLARGEVRDVPWITPAQLVKLYDSVTPSQRSLLMLLGETGLRLGEGLALTWENVTLDGPTPSVHVRSGKTPAARRTVPLSERAVAALRPLRGETDAGPVFTERSGYGVLQAMYRACKKAELPRLRVHDLRHCYASHLVQGGVPPTTVARLLGHSDGGALVCRLYGRWMPQDAERRAQEQLARFRATPTANAS
jgi:integrase